MDQGHYYKPTGEPAHEGGLIEARKHGYYPSVTTVTSILNKEGINQYRVNQVIHAATKLRKKSRETNEDYVARLVTYATAEQEHAVETGQIIHGVFERFFETRVRKIAEIPAHLRVSVNQAFDLIEDYRIHGHPEVSFANHHFGVGGQIDLMGFWAHEEPIVLDFKTQFVRKKLKSGQPAFTAYPEWALQLAAYRHAAGQIADMPEWKQSQCVSFMISTNPEIPGVKVKVWPERHTTHMHMKRALKEFAALRSVYYLKHNLPMPQALYSTDVYTHEWHIAS